jgi:hypothetical protein
MLQFPETFVSVGTFGTTPEYSGPSIDDGLAMALMICKPTWGLPGITTGITLVGHELLAY